MPLTYFFRLNHAQDRFFKTKSAFEPWHRYNGTLRYLSLPFIITCTLWSRMRLNNSENKAKQQKRKKRERLMALIKKQTNSKTRDSARCRDSRVESAVWFIAGRAVF